MILHKEKKWANVQNMVLCGVVRDPTEIRNFSNGKHLNFGQRAHGHPYKQNDVTWCSCNWETDSKIKLGDHVILKKEGKEEEGN